MFTKDRIGSWWPRLKAKKIYLTIAAITAIIGCVTSIIVLVCTIKSRSDADVNNSTTT